MARRHMSQRSGLGRARRVPRQWKWASGIDGKAQIKLAAKGVAAILPPLPLGSLPLRVQLNGAGNCWETTFGAATKNEARKLQAKGPS